MVGGVVAYNYRTIKTILAEQREAMCVYMNQWTMVVSTRRVRSRVYLTHLTVTATAATATHRRHRHHHRRRDPPATPDPVAIATTHRW